MKAVILAGGKATRLGEIAQTIPKALLPVAGVPLLRRQLKVLKRYGFGEILILTGYLGGEIEAYCTNSDIPAKCLPETEPLGTAGALRAAGRFLAGDFLVIYGDIMLDMDLRRLMAFHKEKGAACTLVLHPNDHPQDSDLIEISADGRVTAVHPKPRVSGYYRNLANTGVFVLNSRALDFIAKGAKADFARDVLYGLVEKEKVYGYVTPEYLKDIGTPERLARVSRDFADGRIAAFNLSNKRRAVFLDRDGVLNEDSGWISRPEDFKLIAGAAGAVRRINELGHLAIVATNQPVVARGECTIDGLEFIHKKLETLLGAENAFLDGIYYCPHHPDKGFAGENPVYKTDCSCRKPKTGMIDRAAGDFNIDLSGSWFVGDSDRDIECARRAGLKALAVAGEKPFSAKPDAVFPNLAAAVDFISDEKV